MHFKKEVDSTIILCYKYHWSSPIILFKSSIFTSSFTVATCYWLTQIHLIADVFSVTFHGDTSPYLVFGFWPLSLLMQSVWAGLRYVLEEAADARSRLWFLVMRSALAFPPSLIAVYLSVCWLLWAVWVFPGVMQELLHLLESKFRQREPYFGPDVSSSSFFFPTLIK